MRTMAIVGSGPAGFYTAEAALKAFGDAVRIDIIDRLPTPYGLIRAGVAPDHQSIKAVQKRYHQVANDARVRFLGDVVVGGDIRLGELRLLYDDVVLAVGAPDDRHLGIPGDRLPGVYGSAAFVGWYNGHPDFHQLAPELAGDRAIIIGNGNVAIDCARILAKSTAELHDSDITGGALAAIGRAQFRHIHIVGRRGPHQTSFTMKETGELGELERASPLVDIADFPPVAADQALETGQRRVVEILRRFAAEGPDPAKPIVLHLDFLQRPLRILGQDRVEAVEFMKTTVDGDGKAHDSGAIFTVPCSLVVTAIGYRSTGIAEAPFDGERGRFRNDEGFIEPGLWCVGWARRGPSGTIGTNRTDAIGVVQKIAAASPKESSGADGGMGGPEGFDRLLRERGVTPSTFADWETIDRIEIGNARPGAPREKIATIEALRKAIGR